MEEAVLDQTDEAIDERKSFSFKRIYLYAYGVEAHQMRLRPGAGRGGFRKRNQHAQGTR